jgi:hypothetical protein
VFSVYVEVNMGSNRCGAEPRHRTSPLPGRRIPLFFWLKARPLELK